MPDSGSQDATNRLIDEINKALEEKRFSRASLSRAAGLSEHYVGQLLRGETEPKLSTIKLIAAELNVSEIYILTGMNLVPGSLQFIRGFSSLEKSDQQTVQRMIDGLLRQYDD